MQAQSKTANRDRVEKNSRYEKFSVAFAFLKGSVLV